MKIFPFLLPLISIFGPSCSSGPTMIMADGSKVNLGFSILENTTSEGAKFTGPNGYSLVYTKTGKNQTTGAIALAGGTALKQATAVVKSNNAASVANNQTAAQLAAQKAALAAKPAVGTVVQPGTSLVFPPAAAIPK